MKFPIDKKNDFKLRTVIRSTAANLHQSQSPDCNPNEMFWNNLWRMTTPAVLLRSCLRR
uniref:Uncharacterized protein n=1 Tax=Oryzias melastigma TaxID=30732 RepID=A0A3B3BTH8_ORYME